MDQLTVRGFDPELERRLRQLADEEGLSLSQAALRLLRRGAGLEPVPERDRRIGGALDRYFGVWSEEERAEFDRALEDLERVDEELWR
jgi:hypothetical protein